MPGPGEYNPSSAHYDRTPVYKIGSSKRANAVKAPSPDVRRNVQGPKLAKSSQAKPLKESTDSSNSKPVTMEESKSSKK